MKWLKILLMSVSIIIPFSAHSASDVMHDVATLAGMHCQLWLRQLQQQEPPQNIEDFEAITGQKLDSTQAARLQILTQGLPDFGFIIGARWDVATLSERTDFNTYFMKFLSKTHPLTARKEGSYCNLDISLKPHTPDENNDIFVELPQPRLLEATAYTLLPAKPHALPLTYRLKQDLVGWKIEEITLGKIPLSQTYTHPFNQLIARGGYAYLTGWMIDQLAENPDKAPPTHSQ